MKDGLIAILRGITPQEVHAVGEVLVSSGFTAIEVPLTSPAAYESIVLLRDAYGDSVAIGGGTVLRPGQVQELRDLGTRLIVTPNMNPAVVEQARDLGMDSFIGCATPSEALQAFELGATAIKVFPAQQVTPEVFRAWLDVLPPDSRYIPVGGIDAHGIREWSGTKPSGFGIGGAVYRVGDSLSEVKQKAEEISAAFREVQQHHEGKTNNDVR